MPIRKWSKKIRRDATGSLKLMRDYERSIVHAVRGMTTAIIQFIRNPYGINITIRQYEVRKTQPLPPIDRATAEIDRITEQEFIEKVKPAIKTNVQKAYLQGDTFASIALGGPQIERMAAWQKIGALITKNEHEFQGFSQEASREFKRIISDGIINERTQGQIIKDMQNAGEQLEWKARRIVRTETQIAVNTGVKDRYRDAGIGVVEWLAVGDDKCCDDCESFDGRQWRIDEAPPCPYHPNCRCTLIPVVRPNEEDIEEDIEEAYEG